jgi:hypothetical protein
MKQYLLDISVILDLLLNRAPWAADAAFLWDAHWRARSGPLWQPSRFQPFSTSSEDMRGCLLPRLPCKPA